ncbi:hypothetical protein AK812_SmicGene47489, partial [Symbiodinium microadriaticum]
MVFGMLLLRIFIALQQLSVIVDAGNNKDRCMVASRDGATGPSWIRKRAYNRAVRRPNVICIQETH